MNFLRNPHRPLWRAWTEDRKKILWASEWPMIQAACNMSATEYKLYEDKDGHRFYMFAENVHYAIPMETLKAGGFEPSDFIKKTLKGREPVKST